MFITFEGIEGSGKSTQLKACSEKLTACNIPYLITKEPGGTELGTIIRQWLLNPDTKFHHNYTEVLLFIADRLEHVETIIKPALKKGIIVLCDRYKDSTLAYQLAGRQLDESIISQLNNLADLEPDVTLLFDCSVDVGLSRAKSRAKLDRFEDEDRRFHDHVHQAYQHLAKKHANRFHIIQADDSILNVQSQMFSVLSRYINQLTL
ncbi:dTMP kinase [Candidatus Marinamargulisbacteria bacterium SCGC AG-333-B06]|nr:dTMP kinase [Candidatus Marinamargulisbacteria bacterium SCGC AG-333-B06]